VVETGVTLVSMENLFEMIMHAQNQFTYLSLWLGNKICTYTECSTALYKYYSTFTYSVEPEAYLQNL